MSSPDPWHPDEIAVPLASIPSPRLDSLYGLGTRFPLGGDHEYSQGELDVYPRAGVVRYAGEGIGLTMSVDHPPQVQGTNVMFSSESPSSFQTLILGEQGEVTLFVQPKPKQESLPDVSAHPVETLEEYIAADEPAPARTNTKTATNTEPQPKKGERVELVGRAGNNPRVRTTKGGTLIAKFPLAVHETPEGETDEEITNWFTVVAFRAMAERVSELVKRGEQYQVVGYLQNREYRGKTYEEVNAVAVRTPKLRGGEHHG